MIFVILSYTRDYTPKMFRFIFHASLILLFSISSLSGQVLTEQTKRHIFQGEINRKGKAVGCHHILAVTYYKTAQLIAHSRQNGPFGLFKAKVNIRTEQGKWLPKISNQGFSTFFPENWSEQRTITAIQEAYTTKRSVNGPLWEGVCKEGIVIQMYIHSNGVIASAFPRDWTR